ncbi:thermonuclease family protein [bacterium]|nr:thermonuclease family protein [bacterium]
MSGGGNKALGWLRLVIFAVLLSGGLLASRGVLPLPAGKQQQGKLNVTLKKTVDGDTAWFTDKSGNEIKVRFVGIDAPESGSAAFFASGLQAATLLEQAQRIELEVEPSKPQDKHGRMLAWVWLTMPDGQKLLLQEEMMRSGNAELYRDAKGSLHFSRLEQLAGR